MIITRGTHAKHASASTTYQSRVVDGCDVMPLTTRNTRLVEVANTMDPKLVAAAFGMNPDGVMLYLSDRVDEGRVPPEACAAESVQRRG